MKSYFEHLTFDRRLVILRLLKQTAGYGNDSVLLQGVRLVGHVAVTREEIRADLNFLKDRDLIEIEFINETVMVAKLRERGLDVVEGRIAVEGVKKPTIGGS